MGYIVQINKSSIAAAKLASAVDISLTGDATGTVSFDGSASASIAVTLSNNATARSDLGLGTVATLDTGTSSGNVPVLDSNGKLSTTVIPALAITDIFVKTDIVGATEEAARAAMETWVVGLTAQIGDVAIYTYSWPEVSPHTGSVSGTLIKTATSTPEVFSNWTAITTPTQAQLDALQSIVSAHIGSTGTSSHGVATSLAAGFMPALPSEGGNSKYLNGTGAWADISTISGQTIIATTGATEGALTKVEDHIGVAKSSTEVYSSGVVTYGSGQTAGQAIFVNQSTLAIVYGDLSLAPAGTYNQIGHVVSATTIAIAAVQPVYTVA